MEGTKYAQHNQSNNITCISLLSHIGRNYAGLENQLFKIGEIQYKYAILENLPHHKILCHLNLKGLDLKER